MTAPATEAASVYASACKGYALAGWPCVIPVPPDKKHPPPGGFTGNGGRDTTPDDLAGWAGTHAGYSVALRMPDGVIGIDVDEYAKGEVVKHGADTLAAAVAEFGQLPPTYSSTARGQGQPSRILFYRVPPGRYAGQLGPDVEIIQRHHRYAVVAPSPHAGAGADYRWYGPDGSPMDGKVPGPGELAELPEAWVRRLAEGASPAGPAAASDQAGMALLAACIMPGEPACVTMAAAAFAARAECSAAEHGSRHDRMRDHVYEIVMLAAEGHPGCGDVLTGLQGLWARITAGEGREAAFTDMLTGAARKGAAKYDPAAGWVRFDSCMFINSQPYQAPAPEPAPGELPRPVEPPRYWSPFGAIGTEPFDPAAGLDAPLARDVLARTWPVLRYAPDAGAWIIRGPGWWDVRKGDLAKWAVDLVSWLMLPGDPAAPEGSEEHLRAKKRARFTTGASSNAIAGKMNAQVAAGHHPSAIELAALDSEREILWAGGTAYDLRGSADVPAVSAWTDPGTPHLHSAGVIPQAGRTPLWDDFTAAVWPDADLRAWALRVLSVAFTGYSDKALPILLGETDTGKTSLIMLMMSVLGSYAHVGDARLLAPADRSHASIVYALKGRRLSFIDEAPRTGQQATERLKQITGGSELTGNRMGENPVTFSPTHTLILTANPEHEPHLGDAAIRRRARLIPCDGDPAAVRAARVAIGTENSPAWRAEAPAVLAAMMAEAARWLADPASGENTAAPESGRAAVEEIRLSQDLVLQWLQEECEDWAPGTRARELYQAFTDSCRRMAIHPSGIPSETLWGRRLNSLGYPSRHTTTGNYRPLRIRPLQGFFPTAAELSGASGGGTGSPEGSTIHETAGFPTPQQPVSNGKSAGQTIHETPHNEGLKGTVPDTTHAHAHTHTRTQGGKTSPVIPSSPQPESAAAQPEPKSPKVTKPRAPVLPPLSICADLETGSSGDLFTCMQSDETGFVRLAGMIGPGGQPVITDAQAMLAIFEQATEITGHNFLGFDALALAWHHGADWEQLAAKVRDTELIARQYDPPRSRETGGSSKDRYDLDHVAAMLGLPGKTDDLRRLKREHGGFDHIPLDDPEYRAYLEGDLRATAAVAEKLGGYYDTDPYLPREHKAATLNGRMTLNGFAVDRALLDERLAAGAQRKAQALQVLHDGWGLPLTRTVTRGRGEARHDEEQAVISPLATDAGRDWLAGQYERYQVPDPPRTAKTGKLALGSDDLARIISDPACPGDLRAMIMLMGIVTGIRTVYQNAADHLGPDGRVHPRISMRQASGRSSTTDPGLTVFGKHDGRHIERDILVPDEGHVLFSADLSQVDMRGIAGLCQDLAYMALFADPDRDAHAEIAAAVFGDPHGGHCPKGCKLRQNAKARGHGWNYGLGPARMIAEGADPDLVYAFCNGMETRFPVLCSERDQWRARAAAGEILDDGFGRRLRADPARAYTVAPALMGQGSAGDIMKEVLLRLDERAPELRPYYRVMVHDEQVFSVPEKDAAEIIETVREAFTWEFRGVPIVCDINGPGRTWGEISGGR